MLTEWEGPSSYQVKRNIPKQEDRSVVHKKMESNSGIIDVPLEVFQFGTWIFEHESCSEEFQPYFGDWINILIGMLSTRYHKKQNIHSYTDSGISLEIFHMIYHQYPESNYSGFITGLNFFLKHSNTDSRKFFQRVRQNCA